MNSKFALAELVATDDVAAGERDLVGSLEVVASWTMFPALAELVATDDVAAGERDLVGSSEVVVSWTMFSVAPVFDIIIHSTIIHVHLLLETY